MKGFVMKLLLCFFCILNHAAGTPPRDDGVRYIVPLSEKVSIRGGQQVDKNQKGEPLIVERMDDADGRSSVLFKFEDVKNVPLVSSLNSVIHCKAKAFGLGLNASLSIYAVENNWSAETVTYDTQPKKIEKITDLVLKPNWNNTIQFSVSRYVGQHLDGSGMSFLIEVQSGPGFSQAVEFSGGPSLTIVKAQTPDYVLSDLLRPVWKGNRIVNETLLPTSYDAQPAEANLAFAPSKILSVKNYGLDHVYEEGKDYTFSGRTIHLSAGSEIPFFTYEDLYPNDPNAESVMATVDGGFLFVSETAINQKQLAVTYEHEQEWDGPIPQSAENNLPRTFEKLRNKTPLKLAVFGDSISAGYSASEPMRRTPYMPRWSDLVVDELRRGYESDIHYVNPSLGGTQSGWGRSVVGGMVAVEEPDSVILAFGMNDGSAGVSANTFSANIQAMITSVREKNPNAEFLLVMSFQPNSKWRNLSLMQSYRTMLYGLEGPGIAVADVWSIHEYLLTKKTYWDISGNHINHPNDFMARVYAQTILARLGIE